MKKNPNFCYEKKKCIVNEYASYCVNTKQLSTMLIFFQEMYKTLQKNY